MNLSKEEQKASREARQAKGIPTRKVGAVSTRGNDDSSSDESTDGAVETAVATAPSESNEATLQRPPETRQLNMTQRVTNGTKRVAFDDPKEQNTKKRK